jgi:hypothetical protein
MQGNNLKGILLRVGIDRAFGGYNAPVDPDSREFVYLPIPEDLKRFKPGLETTYDDFIIPMKRFTDERVTESDICLPTQLIGTGCHLDPDFNHLTYGDQPTGRGRKVACLNEGDFIAFFAGLKPVRQCDENLIYALIGIYFVKRLVRVRELVRAEWGSNAHSRRRRENGDDVVVVADSGRSGRFETCIPIGTYRSRAYRVREDLLDRWGGLDVKDGFIQRSINPPSFLDPKSFLHWLGQQDTGALLHRNN